MSTMSRRVLTVTVAAVIAVFTGVLVGLLSARASCTPVLAPKAAASPAAAQTTAVSSPVAGLGGSHAEPVRRSAAPAEPAAVAERQPVCGCRAAPACRGGPDGPRACLHLRAGQDHQQGAGRPAWRGVTGGRRERGGAGRAALRPGAHEAGGATPSDDPSKVGTIAAVEVPGYSDRGRVLRPPVVTVYQPGGKKLHTDPEDPQS